MNHIQIITVPTITAEELVEHIGNETEKAVDYGMFVGTGILACFALSALVGLLLRKL